jgi:hypothetical protein
MGKGFAFINFKMATVRRAIPAKHSLGFVCPQNLAHALSGGQMCLLKLRAGHGMVGP